MILRTDHWLPKLLNVNAITIYPYVFCADKFPTEQLLKHEKAHIKQVQKHGWFQFYLSYLLYYAAGRISGKSHFAAYHDIPWEVEARDVCKD